MGYAVFITIFALFVLVQSSHLNRDDRYNNYYNQPESRPPVVKTEVQPAGKETQIRCNIRDRVHNVKHGLNITWEYKPCIGGHASACRGNWTTLCGPLHSLCSPTLILMQPRSHDSGLYRCSVTLNSASTIINVYLLQFIEMKREPPVILTGPPRNMSVVAPLLAVLQCKVSSTVPPTVRWFRRLEPSDTLPSPTHSFIEYLNNTYQLLNCCPVAPLSQKDLYLSKLVISPSSVADAGIYICVAINDANYTYQQTHLQVLPASVPAPKNPRENRSFFGLFLIPAALALVPILIWIICYRPHKEAEVKSTTESERHLVLSTDKNTQSKTIPTDICFNNV